jgi:Ca2+-dependent lipid-binding protein
LTLSRKPKATAIASDADKGPPQYDLPAPSTAGVLPAPGGKTANGDVHEPEEDDEDHWWKKVGWAPRFGDGIPADVDFSTNLSDQQTWVEERLQDKFFGDWYYNAGVIIFACLASWVVAVLGGGLGWVFLIMATCGTYYRTSIRRVRRNFRDDIQREMAKARLETDTESLEWVNSFLVKFWPIYAPVLCKTIIMTVDQVLSVATPPMVESLKMKMFTLGTKPPRLEHVKTYPKSEDDIVLMDWKFSFTPNDTADMTARQIKVKENPKIVLEVRLGKGIVSKGLDVIVEDMACSGIMRVKVKLQLPPPHIDRVEICFLERPVLDYVCKPLGGDTFGFDINFIPGLESFIQEQIHANLGPMMYAPNVFPIEIAKMLAGNPVDQAIGVVQITFHGAQGLRNPDQFSGTPDPYATVAINDRQELGRTKTVRENANPRWNETINIIVTSLKDNLNVHVFDFNDIRKDRELGQAAFSLERFETDDEYENEPLELNLNGKPRGVVQADLRFFPVLEPTKLQDGTVEPAPESTTGIARFNVEQAKDLDGTKSLIGSLNPYAVLLLNGKEIHVSKKLHRTNNPIWSDANKEILITDRRSAKLGLIIKDDRELGADPIIGRYNIKLDDMLDLTTKGQEWYNLAGVKTGRAKMSVQWKPVGVKGALGGFGGYITPIGVVRLWFKNARELRNVETVGKSDPYARVLLSGVQKGRTVTWKNNLNPDWDEVIYVPVHSTREKLTVEVMDEENMGRDRSLGHLEIPLTDYIVKEDTGEYATKDSKQLLARPLQSAGTKTAKGFLNFTCSFFPTIPTVDPEEEEREKEEATNGEVPSTPTDDIRKSNDTFKSADGTPKKSADAARTSVDLQKTRARSGTGATTASQKTNGSSDLTKTSTLDKSVVPEVPKIRITADNLMDYGALTRLDMSRYSSKFFRIWVAAWRCQQFGNRRYLRF